MALTIDSTKVIDFQRYLDKLVEIGSVYVDKEKFTEKQSQLASDFSLASKQLTNKLRIYSKGVYIVLDGNGECIAETASMLGVPKNKFTMYDKRTHSARFSMDRAKVIDPLMEKLRAGELKLQNKEAVLDLLQSYCEYKDAKSAVSGGKTKQKYFKETGLTNKFDKKLYAVDFSYNLRATNRVYTKDDNIQGWNKRYVRSISAPKGKFLVWMDFAQIDLRVAINLFLRTDDNKEIFESTEDKYEAVARALYRQLGKPFVLEDFKAVRPLYKVLVLAKLYGSGNERFAATTENEQEAILLDKFYAQCDKLNQYKATIRELLKLEDDIDVKDYFGSILPVPISTPNPESVLINRPVQATSAMIMPATANAIIDAFLQKGYKEEQIQILLNRHDELIFMMDEELKKDLWILKDFSTIYIDDWDALALEIGIGDYYKEENKDYMDAYEECWKQELGEDLRYATRRKLTTRDSSTYFPVEELCAIVRGEPSGFDEDEFKTAIMREINKTRDSWDKFTQYHGYLELAKELDGKSFVINITRGMVCRLPNTYTLGQIAKALKTTKVFIDARGVSSKEYGDISVISKYSNFYNLYSLLEILSKSAEKDNQYYLLNRDRIAGMIL